MPQRPLNQVLAMPASWASSQSTEACSFLKAKSATSGRGNLGLSRPRSLARIAGARASALCFAPASPSPARERITSSLSRASATARPALFQRLSSAGRSKLTITLPAAPRLIRLVRARIGGGLTLAMNRPIGAPDPDKLRELAAWYREFSERAGSSAISDSRLRIAGELEKEADLLEEERKATE